MNWLRRLRDWLRESEQRSTFAEEWAYMRTDPWPLIELGLVRIAQSCGYSRAASEEIVTLVRMQADPWPREWHEYGRVASEVRRFANLWPMMVAHGLAADASMRGMQRGMQA